MRTRAGKPHANKLENGEGWALGHREPSLSQVLKLEVVLDRVLEAKQVALEDRLMMMKLLELVVPHLHLQLELATTLRIRHPKLLVVLKQVAHPHPQIHLTHPLLLLNQVAHPQL